MNKLSDEWRDATGKYIKHNLSRNDLAHWLMDRSTKNKHGCWLWNKSLHRDGYAKIDKEGFCQGHRLSYYVFYSSYSPDLLVLHKCHVRSCVNPRHLYQGTHIDNARDTVRAGRAKGIFESGERHWNYKYSDKQIAEIKSSNLSSYKLSEILGIPASTIRSLRNGNGRRT